MLCAGANSRTCVVQIVMGPMAGSKEKRDPPLQPQSDFVLDVKQRQASLTELGLEKVFARLSKLPLYL